MDHNISDKGLISLVALTFVPGIGSKTARKILSLVKDPELIFQVSPKDYIHNKILNTYIANILKDKNYFLKMAETELKFANKNLIQVLHLLHEDYPFRLLQCDDAPVVLYKKGNAHLNSPKVVAIVGTRRATQYGKQCVEQLVEGIKTDNVQIVSGLAIGIDSVAHKSALDNGLQTIAVLGTGLNMIYPAINKKLADKIIEHGALITEFSMQLRSDKFNFPRRNRIIAGMSDAVVIAETGIRGGALITAHLANNYNRDVFAFPGRVNDQLSAGCNWLINSNRAALITSVEDLYLGMNWNLPGKIPNYKQQTIPVSAEEERVLKFLIEHKECGLDFICESLNLSISKVSALLFQLELSGLVRSLPGKRYCRY